MQGLNEDTHWYEGLVECEQLSQDHGARRTALGPPLPTEGRKEMIRINTHVGE